MCRANIEWQPILLTFSIIKCIAKYVAKVEKSSERYHEILRRLAIIENLDDLASKAFMKFMTETIIERDIPLVESSRRYFSLNVSWEIFKPIVMCIDMCNEEQTKSIIEGYITRPFYMEDITLLDVARSWIYNPRWRRNKKWELREK